MRGDYDEIGDIVSAWTVGCEAQKMPPRVEQAN